MLTYDDEGFDAEQARRDTEDAIRAGEADVIYQAYLSDGTWRGFADFLERQPDGTYEPVDTKLARSAKPLHVLQLCFYAEQLGRIQGRLPEHVHVELGTGERETFRTAEFIAFFRRSRERFLAALDGATGAGDDLPVARATTAGSATSATSAGSSSSTTTTSSSSPGSAGCTRSGSRAPGSRR